MNEIHLALARGVRIAVRGTEGEGGIVARCRSVRNEHSEGPKGALLIRVDLEIGKRLEQWFPVLQQSEVSDATVCTALLE